MKTQIKTMFIIVLSTMVFYGCDDESTGLLKDLAEGKMVVVENNDDEILLDCFFEHYGEGDGLTGEVFITGINTSSMHQQHFGIVYGSYTNEIPFAVKTYKSNGSEGTDVHINCWAGNTDDDAIMTVKIISITDTAIKGEFEGEVKDGNGLKTTIKGAFWAKKLSE